MNRVLAALAALLLGLLQVGAARAQDTVYYYSSDTARSEVVITDASRNVVERTQYSPYGQVLNRGLRDGPGYTGHEEDPETSLVYMQQRYFDPESGRFLSNDPVATADNGGGFSRYGYANDNPYRYTDPDGREGTGKQDSPDFEFGTEESSGGYDSAFPALFDQYVLYPALTDTQPAASAATKISPWACAKLGMCQPIPEPSAGAVATVLLTYAAEFIPELGLGAAEGAAAATDAGATEGMTVYRVFGGEARGLGRSWTTVNPGAVSDFRATAGLFPGNSGQFVIEGTLTDTTGVTLRSALPGLAVSAADCRKFWYRTLAAKSAFSVCRASIRHSNGRSTRFFYVHGGRVRAARSTTRMLAESKTSRPSS